LGQAKKWHSPLNGILAREGFDELQIFISQLGCNFGRRPKLFSQDSFYGAVQQKISMYKFGSHPEIKI
jgi:hypothetical protein